MLLGGGCVIIYSIINTLVPILWSSLIFTTIFGRIVALIGSVLTWSRQSAEAGNLPALGTKPQIPQAKPQGLPTLKAPTARGWDEGHVPTATHGLKVNAFAAGLKHPR